MGSSENVRPPILHGTFSIAAYDPGTQSWGVATQSKYLAVGAVVPWARAERRRHRYPIARQRRLRPGQSGTCWRKIKRRRPCWRRSPPPTPIGTGGKSASLIGMDAQPTTPARSVFLGPAHVPGRAIPARATCWRAPTCWRRWPRRSSTRVTAAATISPSG